MSNRAFKRRRRSVLPAIAAVLLLFAGCMELVDIPCTSVAVVLPVSSETGGRTDTDRIAPSITGVRDLTVYAGDTVSYLKDIIITDNRDLDPRVTVDTSQVDLSAPGTYEVVYTATDAAGNSSRAAALVTVLEKENGFVDMETINAAADEKLEELLWDGATVEEQVRVIYNWARGNLSYGGHSDRTDYHQTAYTMLRGGRGDCFGYFAVTKLLFERLEIPNIDVQKVRNFADDSDHFWSLVSVDGGETYYHFDATPRVGDGDDFCLVTDAFLDAYSAANDGSHNRDKSLYPATPEA
ncbi:MAG: transglutaminase domain-containing protein [Oscillospiraceae bacterium]|nr:transglutaminase domain-containing protein [Oscillospiraceae bacterium]